jgi:hypothetical protein
MLRDASDWRTESPSLMLARAKQKMTSLCILSLGFLFFCFKFLVEVAANYLPVEV